MIPEDTASEPQASSAEEFAASTPEYERIDPRRRDVTLTLLRGALLSLTITIAAGTLAVLFYLPTLAAWLVRPGLSFSALRPIHTTFAAVWIFLGGLAMVHHHLQEQGREMQTLEQWRTRTKIVLWVVAAIGILATLPMGITSGREYLGFHPIFSIIILLGWLLFAWNFFSILGRGFWNRPVYVTMWGVGVLFFIFTFLEQHVYLFEDIYNSPIRDLRIQWKATGTLVGSFNLFVYGTLYYLGEKLSGDRDYAYSKLAYALFGVGLLNSFTNFAHHTYHLPQADVIKWISFVVSMTEALLLIRVISDIARSTSKREPGPFDSTRFFLTSAKWWTGAMLFSAILLSIPPLNAFVHGTHLVTGHAMGTEIGIDSMVLFAAVGWLLGQTLKHRGDTAALLHSNFMKFSAVGLNLAAGGLVTWLHVSGIIVGIRRYQLLAPPEWFLQWNSIIFAALGIATACFLGALLVIWLRVAFASSGLRSKYISP